MKNIFDLYRIKRWREATTELKSAIEKFNTEYQRIKNSYPNIGIGDTATDEAIADEVYSRIHWKEDLG